MSPFHADDPRLTSYVLGELSPAEAAEVEQLLRESSEARAAVAELRQLSETLSKHLPAEPSPSLQPAQRAAVLHRSASTKAVSTVAAAPRRGGNAAVVVASACLMIAAVVALTTFTHNSADGPAENATARSEPNSASYAKLAALSEAELRLVLRKLQDEKTLHDSQQDPRSKAGSELGEQEVLAELKKRISLAVKAEQPAKSPAPFSPGAPSTGPGKPGSLSGKLHPTSGMTYAGKQTQFGRRNIAGRGGIPRAYYGRGMHFGGGAQLGQQTMFEQVERLKTRLSYQPVRQWSKNRNESLGKLSRLSVIRDFGGRDRDRWGLRLKTRSVNGTTNFGILSSNGMGLPALNGLPNRGMQGVDRYNYFQLGLEAKRPGNQQLGAQNSVGVPVAGGMQKQKQGDRQAPAMPTFDVQDVKRIRKHFAAQFEQLAQANPNRVLNITRVKDRLAGNLKRVEQQVAAIEKAGKKVPFGEGLAVIDKVVQDEIEGLDLDGDGKGDFSRETYDTIVENAFKVPLADPLSTFSIDVDTASFSNVRRFLAHGQLPPRNAVRIEEMLNYFRYDYDRPTGNEPFSVNLEVGPCPWNTKHRLLRIGLQGREIPHDKRPPSNLVFLIDVSGSMKSSKKLPLVKTALEMLVNQMTAKDRISIVTYANDAVLVLEPTSGDQKDKITTAIHKLVASGSTNGAAGIQLAYAQAKKHLLKKGGGTNRVILCTDGDLNVGIKSDDELVKLIEQKRDESRIFLSVFGFGTGNLKESKLEKIADKGNGHYAYIDGPGEAKKVFVEEMTGMLYTIAKDVKVQLEFNPTQVGSYRLIGYENRILSAQDFNDDKKDAGEIGAGHTVTALYEIVPAAQSGKKQPVDDLKYQKRVAPAKAHPATQELLTVKLRYKQPNGDKSVKREFAVTDRKDKKAMPSLDFEWASAVAMYGLLLRDSKYAGSGSLDLVRELAAASRGADPHGHRKQFLKMVYHTRALLAGKLGKPIPAPRPFEAGALREK